MTFPSLVDKVKAGVNLTEAEAESAIGQIMEGRLPTDLVKEFLLGLRKKGEALSEVVGAARAMRAHATPIRVDLEEGGVMVDTCGTGGDGLKTVNVSTIAALVVAAAGVPVAKHGNRSITSSCGSADLLEALGVAIDVAPSVVEQCIRETGFGFLFAPRFHPAMKAVAPIRKELGVPTIFNLLGPLTNPAGVKRQVVGVADSTKMELYAKALDALGVEHTLIVHGADGQDEISTTGPTEVLELTVVELQSRIEPATLTPEMFGIRRARLEELKGGDPAHNARVAQELFSGHPGPVRDAVLVNAAAALYVAGAAGDLEEGLPLVAEAIDRGRARSVLDKVRKLTNE